MFQPFAVALLRVEVGAGGCQRILRLAKGAVGARSNPDVDPRETVEQRAVAGSGEQPAIIVLAVDLDQMRAEFAQQRGRGGGAVDEGTAAAIRLDDAAHDQRLARLDVEAVVGEQRRDRSVRMRGVEGGGDDRLRGALPHQPGIAARAQRQPERIEQDRLARTGLAGQHAETFVEIEVERLDQHHVTNGKRGQHVSPYGLTIRPFSQPA
jgi:hypothetical protein